MDYYCYKEQQLCYGDDGGNYIALYLLNQKKYFFIKIDNHGKYLSQNRNKYRSKNKTYSVKLDAVVYISIQEKINHKP